MKSRKGSWQTHRMPLKWDYITNSCLSAKAAGTVIARSVFGDEAISAVLRGDCFGKKRLAMTGLGIFGQALIHINNALYEKEKQNGVKVICGKNE